MDHAKRSVALSLRGDEIRGVLAARELEYEDRLEGAFIFSKVLMYWLIDCWELVRIGPSSLEIYYLWQGARGSPSSAPGWWRARPTGPTAPTRTTSSGTN